METPVLDSVIEAMEIAVEKNKPIEMADFFYDEMIAVRATNIHNCGTAACICGYASLHPATRELSGLPPIVELDGHRDASAIGVMGTESREVWVAVRKELRPILNNSGKEYHIADAMFAAYGHVRRDCARAAGMPKHLLNLPHLRSDALEEIGEETQPTAQEALDFLRAIRDWVHEQAERAV